MTIQNILCLLHDKTILDKAPSHASMGKSDNGEDLAGAGSIQFIYQNYIHMNIQLLIFLLFAIASAAIIFYLESSKHESLELRSTSVLTMDNIEPTLKEFGAKQIRFTDNWVQFNYDGDDFIVGLSAKPIVRLYFA